MVVDKLDAEDDGAEEERECRDKADKNDRAEKEVTSEQTDGRTDVRTGR